MNFENTSKYKMLALSLIFDTISFITFIDLIWAPVSAYLLTKILVRVAEKLQVFNVIYFISQCFLLFRERPDIVHINNGGYPGADSCRIMAITSRLFSIKKIVFTIMI